MDHRFRPTFYQHLAQKRYIRESFFGDNHLTTADIEGEIVRNCDRETIQAEGRDRGSGRLRTRV